MILQRKSRTAKRRQLKMIGFQEVLTNTLIDAITEEELEIPRGDVLELSLSEEQQRRINNRVIRKIHGKPTKNSRGEHARKKYQAEKAVDDFMSGMDEIELKA